MVLENLCLRLQGCSRTRQCNAEWLRPKFLRSCISAAAKWFLTYGNVPCRL
jgi:hypothetical protein